MKLPIPIFSNGKFYDEVEVRKPKTGVLADTQASMEQGDVFSAMSRFIAGSIESISCNGNTEDVPDRIKTLTRRMPYRSAEYVAIMILLLLDNDDGIEGVYDCPRCNHRIISELDDENDVDTRDFISKLNVGYQPEYEETFTIALESPVKIINMKTKEVLYTVESVELSYPTMEHAIHAFRKTGNRDTIRRQLAIYSEALKKINDEEVDHKIRNQYGMFIFENLDSSTDLKAISEQVYQYGLDTEVIKVCPNCGKKWKAVINTSSFFASGLPSV